MSGIKHDQTKLRLELIPPELLQGVAAVLTYGAAKYADRNWEQGIHWSRVYGALQRHLTAFWAGEQVDPESGFPHLWHAGCCIAFLIAFDARKGVQLDPLLDDRPHIGPAVLDMEMMGFITAQAIQRYRAVQEAKAQPQAPAQTPVPPLDMGDLAGASQVNLKLEDEAPAPAPAEDPQS